MVVYDRSALISRAVKNPRGKLLEESIVVALVCLAFLMHLRSAFVAILILPHRRAHVFPPHVRPRASAPISCPSAVSAIAIGAMVDAVIIMIEKCPQTHGARSGQKPHWDIHSRRRGRGRPYALLLAAGHHRFIRPCLLPCRPRKAASLKPLRLLTKTYSMGAAAILLHHARAHPHGLLQSAAKFRPRKGIPSTASSSSGFTILP